MTLMATINNTTMNKRRNILSTTLMVCAFVLAMLSSCTERPRPKLIGVSQCSEDIWRDKLNRELVIGSYVTDGMQLEFLSADDDDQKQINQIQQFIDRGVDLLIVAPNSAERLSPVIDKAYDKGIPVILFDRRTTSDKYTTYISSDNYAVGHTMGELIAKDMQGQGVLVEITGLKGSSPAMERHRGFNDAVKAYPGIRVISSELGDWTEQSGEQAMRQILTGYDGPIDCIFGHNDRLAMGARKVALEHGMTDITYYGVDALPIPGGGADLVNRGIMKASYNYPTKGIDVMRVASRILNGEKVEKTIRLESSVIDRQNAAMALYQYKEQQHATEDIERIYDKLDDYFAQVNIQQKVIIFFSAFTLIIIALSLITYRSYIVKHRLNQQLSDVNKELSDVNTQLKQRNGELQTLYRQLEDMADARLVFFTNVGHQLRTPLTLISGPVEKLAADSQLSDSQHKLVDMMQRNLSTLTMLVDEILDFRKIGSDQQLAITLPETVIPSADGSTGTASQDTETPAHTAADNGAAAAMDSPADTTAPVAAEKPELLVVDDNEDVRTLLHAILSDKYNVTLAADGQQGLEAARRLVPDLIVSDVMMPVMDGLEMCRHIRTDNVTCHIPVLMLTARTLEEQRVAGYAHGADAYITKPFSTAVLLARIENLLVTRRTLLQAFTKVAAAPMTQPQEHDSIVTDNIVTVTASDSADADNAANNAASHASAIVTPEIDERDATFVMRLRRIIQDKMSDSDFSVERIGEEIGMSRVQLYRKTKALTGMSPVELLRRSRLEKGRRLLEVTDKTISEIAYEVGFSAPSYFTKCFKDEYGTSPGDIRNSSNNQ